MKSKTLTKRFTQVLALVLTIVALSVGQRAQASITGKLTVLGLKQQQNGSWRNGWVIKSTWGQNATQPQVGANYTFSNSHVISGDGVDVYFTGTLDFQAVTSATDVITGSNFTMTFSASDTYFISATVKTTDGSTVTGCTATLSSNNREMTLQIPKDKTFGEVDITYATHPFITSGNTTISGLNTPFIYGGSAVEPEPVVTYTNPNNSTTTLTAGTDYTVSYSNNSGPGTATITITGAGGYYGTLSRSYTIRNVALSDFTSLGSNTYAIATKDDLDHLAFLVDYAGNNCSGLTFKQTADITYTHGNSTTEQNFTTIGGYFSGGDKDFSGTFDGQNYSISGLRVYATASGAPNMNKGLFGRISGATIQNVILTDARITGFRYVGGIVGNRSNNSTNTVENCLVMGTTVTCTDTYDNYYAGAITGNSLSTLNANYYRNCSVAFNRTSTTKTTDMGIGGSSSSGDQDGARSVHTLTLGENITATGESVTYQGTTYYASNTTVILGYDNLAAGYQVTYGLNGTPLSGNTFTMSATDGARVGASLSVITYNITYDLDGGALPDGQTNPATYTAETESFTLNNPTRKGCLFAGWTGTGLDGATQNVTVAQGSAGDRSYTANWTDVWGITGGADGTETNPYVITTTAGLDLLSIEVKAGDNFSEKFFELGDDIAYSTEGLGPNEGNFTSIGGYFVINDTGGDTDFSGTFDGKNHTISGLRIIKPQTNQNVNKNVGLFGRAINATVKNVIIADASFKGYSYVGGIAGHNTGSTVQNCLVVGTSISYKAKAGGAILGSKNGGTLTTNHYHDCTVNGKSTNVGVGGSGTTSSDQDGARSVHTLTLGENVTATGESVTYQDVTYYAANTTVTLTYTGTVPEGTTAVYWVNGTVIEGNSFTMPAADATVNGSTSTVYTVTYDLAGGALPVGQANRATYFEAMADFTLVNPIRTGYIFAGWTGTGLDGATQTVTVAQGSTGNRSYTANWTDVWGMADGANGTRAHPYKISSTDGLDLLAKNVNGTDGFTANEFNYKHFLQTANITYDGTENNYTPVGDIYHYFCGHYNGGGYTISGININVNDNDIGIFGFVYTPGIVENLTLANSTLYGFTDVGGIVGFLYGDQYDPDVSNCRVESDVTIGAASGSAPNLGGIVGGFQCGVISGCISAATITNNDLDYCQQFGGIVGKMNNVTVIKDCLYTGTTVTPVTRTGALVGTKTDKSSLTNNYYTSAGLPGGVSGTDTDGARLARTITLGVGIALEGNETAYNVSGLTAIGTTVLRNGETLYSGEGQTVKLRYTGIVPEGYELVYLVNGTAIEGNSFTMPAADVSVSVQITKEAVTPTERQQIITLSAGWNWVSFNVETTLDDLKTALLETLPGTSITIYSKSNGNTTYNGSRWRGSLSTLDVAQMYLIEVRAASEITLEALNIDPAEHPLTISNGDNWMAFPLNEAMTVADAFAGFALTGDVITSQNAFAVYIDNSWRGTLTTLEPGQGYIYHSAASESRVFTFPDTHNLVYSDFPFVQYESHWSDFDYHAYQFNSPVVAAIQINDDYIVSSGNWADLEIAAFVGDECRGHAFMADYLDDFGDPYPIVELLVYYNTVGEPVTFKLYDHANGIEYDICTPNIDIVTEEQHVEAYWYSDESVSLDFSPYNLVLADNDSEEPDDEKNTSVLASYAGQAINVTLSDRTLFKDGCWNTLCLPFSVDDIEDSPLKGATIMELDLSTTDYENPTGLDTKTGTLYLNFKPVSPSGEQGDGGQSSPSGERGDGGQSSPSGEQGGLIKAGKPYIIKWGGNVGGSVTNPYNSGIIVSPVFTGVTIPDTYTDADAVENALNDNAVTFSGGQFVGTFSYTEYTEENRSILLLGDNNTLYWPQPAHSDPGDDTSEMVYPSIGAFRAYFQLADGITVADISEARLNFETQGIKSLTPGPSPKGEGSIYTLSGVKLDKQPTRKGIYIHNGKKVVIK